MEIVFAWAGAPEEGCIGQHCRELLCDELVQGVPMRRGLLKECLFVAVGRSSSIQGEQGSVASKPGVVEGLVGSVAFKCILS